MLNQRKLSHTQGWKITNSAPSKPLNGSMTCPNIPCTPNPKPLNP